jgi:hypothetical protein
MEAIKKTSLISQRSNQKFVAKLTKREFEILHFINEFGFCEIRHIMKRFSIKKSASYSQMQFLNRLGFVHHEYIVPDKPGAYSVTQKGVRIAKHDFPPVSRISSNTYLHQLKVITVSLNLKSRYATSEWITERRLLRNKCDSILEINHLPDGVLTFGDDKKVAVEIEMSLKNRERLIDIFTDYEIQKTF